MVKLLFGARLESYERELLRILDYGAAGAEEFGRGEGFDAAHSLWGAEGSDGAERYLAGGDAASAVAELLSRNEGESAAAGVRGLGERIKRALKRAGAAVFEAFEKAKGIAGLEAAENAKGAAVLESSLHRLGERVRRAETLREKALEASRAEAEQAVRKIVAEEVREAALGVVFSGGRLENEAVLQGAGENGGAFAQGPAAGGRFIRSESAGAPDTADMQKISDFFRRDSRRYDGGFKRY